VDDILHNATGKALEKLKAGHYRKLQLNDLAILKIEANEFMPFKSLPYNFKTEIMDLGAEVFTLGYPMALFNMGTDIKYTNGTISSKTGFQGSISEYQISVPIQPGNSGGPLFDADGSIVGLTSAGFNRSLDITENVNYAIKSVYLKTLIDIACPNVVLPRDTTISNKNLTEKLRILSEYVVLVKTR
jgi:S1-C subfamily serine protease